MAVRTDATTVKEVLAGGGDYHTRSSPSLTIYITTASALIDDVLICAARKGIPIDSVRATLLESWAAAHYYKVSDQAMMSKNTAGASAVYQGNTMREGLRGTKYGQTAIELDPSGCLAQIASGKTASVKWGGKPEKDWLDYNDRNI